MEFRWNKFAVDVIKGGFNVFIVDQQRRNPVEYQLNTILYCAVDEYFDDVDLNCLQATGYPFW